MTRHNWQQWQLEDNIPEAYEKHMVPMLFKPIAKKLIEYANPKAEECVLDVACGTGIVARLVASQSGTGKNVIGIDLNPSMLNVAKNAALNEGFEIEWREGSATKLPFLDEMFDVVFCQFSLQYFPDKLLALKEMYRVLKPNGRVLLSLPRSIQYSPSTFVLAKALKNHISDEALAMMQKPFSLCDKEEIRELVTQAGFKSHIKNIVEPFFTSSIEEFVHRQISGSPLAQPVGQATDAARTALLSEVVSSLQDYVDDDGMVHPIEAHFVLATKGLM